jgi:hypothetical protein
VNISHKTTKEELQERFVQLLRELTDQSKVEWTQEKEPGHVHCMVGEEYITFEVLSADNGHVRADDDKIAYVASYCRNVTYVWVRGVGNWNTLLDMLQQVPIGDERFSYFRGVTQDLPVRVLERMVQR